MSKIIAIHQPETLPWCGFFYKMMQADEFIFLDNVQFKKNNYQNRNRIIHAGNPKWLTFPVDMKGRLSSTIRDIQFSYNVDWVSRNLKMLEDAYKGCPYFEEHMSSLIKMINVCPTLITLNVAIICYMMKCLDINTSIIFSSDIKVDSHKSDLVLDICKDRGATTYISGQGGREYLSLDKFEESDIKVVYSVFDSSQTYKQKSKEFIPYMSVIDLLMNNSNEDARNYILSAFSLEE